MNWTELLTEEMTATYGATEGLLELLSDDDLHWKPATGDNWMTVGQLLFHINGSCGLCCQGFVTGDWGMPEGAGDGEGGDHESMLPPAEKMPSVANLAEAREKFAADRKVAFAMLEKAGEAQLAEQMSAAPWDPENQRLLGHHLLHMVNHLSIHKAQLFYYLKLMGHKVDTMTLWGM